MMQVVNARQGVLEQFDDVLFNALVERIDSFARAFLFCIEDRAAGRGTIE